MSTDLSGEVIDIKNELVTILGDIVSGDKPKTKADAHDLYHKITVAVGTWLVTELPPLEAKALLCAIWAEKKIGCLGS